MLTITPARPEDAQTIIRLRRQAWDETYRGIYPDAMIDHFDEKWHLEQEQKRIFHPQIRVFLLQIRQKPMGYLTLRMGKEAVLLSLYLLKPAQGKGFGKAALAFAKERFAAAGYDSFTLQCQPDNLPARRFYEHMGGVFAGEEPGDQRWQDTVIYRFIL